MANYIFNLFYMLMSVLGNVAEGFTAKLTAKKLAKLKMVRISSLQLDVELDDDGMCIPPSDDGKDKGSLARLSRADTNVSLAAGLTDWLLTAHDIECACNGANPKCVRCNGTGTGKDVEYLKGQTLPDERERTTTIAVMADAVRRNIKEGKWKHMLLVTKGNQMFLCTAAALERLVGETADGKAIKRAGYFAGYYLYDNLSDSQRVRVAILKEEDDFNGQLMWNVEMALDLEAHAIRLLEETIVKGSARSVCSLENAWGKKIMGIVEDDVIGVATHELIKRVAKSDIVKDCGHYYIIEFDIADLKIVNPPLKQGFPGLGLSLWKYGIEGLKMNKMITGGIRQLKALKLLKRAIAGDYEAESTVLGVKMPKEGDPSAQSPFYLSIPGIKDGNFVWKTPKDKQSWSLIWNRFYKYMMNNILRIEMDGLKGMVASCSIVLDAYEHAYHLQNPGKQVAFAFFPDQPVRTSTGKISMEDALNNDYKQFVMIKNPTSSIRQFTTLTLVGAESMLRFLLTGIVDILEDDEPILSGKGALVISSNTMQHRNCVQDFDGDQPVLAYFDKECCPVVPEPIDWLTEFATKESNKKVNLATEQEKLEYYSDLMMTIIAARQAIAPMVLGSLAGYVEVIVRAFNDKVLGNYSSSVWDKGQRLLSAIAEIYAIKKEKSMADAADKKQGWLWVDMFLELYIEGKEMIPVRRKTTKMEAKRSALIRNLVRPKGESVVENPETGEYENVASADKYDIMKTLVRNAKLAINMPPMIKDFFPALHLMCQFNDVNVQMHRRQPVNPRAANLIEMGSDMQLQQAILKRTLEYCLTSMSITKMSGTYVTLEKAAREFITEIREGIKEVMGEFDSADDSIEKLEMIRESQTYATNIMVEEGLCEANEETPWIPGKGLGSDREYLFALLVGIKDMQYVSRENLEGERTIEDGKRSSFNRVTAEGMRRLILGYFGTVATLTINDFVGNGDMRAMSDFPGFDVPKWVGDVELEHCSISEEEAAELEII
jgi:hypothetical protein